MAPCYKFAIIRLAPDDVRDERLNIGAIILKEDDVDIRLSRRLDKVRSISGAIEPAAIRELMANLKSLDGRLRGSGVEKEKRLEMLSRVGPISLSKFGTFLAAEPSEYEERVVSILKAMVDAEPARRTVREKRSKLLTQVKTTFRKERVLAKRDETIDSHRIVPCFELDEGLVADLVLKNGAYHVIETVDASGFEDSLRKAITDIGVAALVLERARMKFGDAETKARLVYSASSALENVAKPSLDAAAHFTLSCRLPRWLRQLNLSDEGRTCDGPGGMGRCSSAN
jgi:hypothetical protein